MNLLTYMKAQAMSDEEMAEKIGCEATARAVRNWKYGDRTPSVTVIVRIEEVTAGAVTVRDFIPDSAPRPKDDAA